MKKLKTKIVLIIINVFSLCFIINNSFVQAVASSQGQENNTGRRKYDNLLDNF